MHPTSSLDRVFPLSQGSSERPLIRPPKISLPFQFPAAAASESSCSHVEAERRDTTKVFAPPPVWHV